MVGCWRQQQQEPTKGCQRVRGIHSVKVPPAPARGGSHSFRVAVTATCAARAGVSLSLLTTYLRFSTATFQVLGSRATPDWILACRCRCLQHI
jgi:hypothetical protein